MSVNNINIQNKHQNFQFDSPSNPQHQYQQNINKNSIQKTISSSSNMQSNMNTNNFKLSQSQSMNMKNLSSKNPTQKPQIFAQNNLNIKKSLLDNSS